METTDATAAARTERTEDATSAPATTVPDVSAGATVSPTSPSAAEASAEATRAEPAAEEKPDAPAKKDPEPERTARQSWTYAVAAAAYLVAPFVIGLALPAAAATTALLVLLPTAALLLGLADGLVFRTTWAFPILTAILCFVGLQVYTNDGTWIYALGVLALTRVGTALGGRRRTKG